MKKVLTVGVYDLTHYGHFELFRKARTLGDYLIVAVQDSSAVNRFKPETNLICTLICCDLVNRLHHSFIFSSLSVSP